MGVEYVQDKKTTMTRTVREVLLCGGAVNTPQLLLLSGIGDPEILRRFDIDVVAELKGVGRNLQDHLDCSIQYECTEPITFYSFNQLLPRLKAGLQYTLFGSGPATDRRWNPAPSSKAARNSIRPTCNSISSPP